MRRGFGLAVSFLLVAVFVLGSGSAAPTFGTPVPMPATGGAFEPGIDIAADGTIFVNGPPGIPIHSKLWRSMDGGATFSARPFNGNFGRLPGGGDSDVVTRAGGRVYFIDLWAGSNSIARSEDNGSTWTAGTPITTLPLSDRQWVELGVPNGAQDTVHVVYALIEPPRQVMIATSTDSGQTFTQHVPAPGVTQATGFTGPLVSDRAGFLAFPYEDGGILRVATSTNDPASWSRSIPIGSNVLNLMPTLAMSGNHLYAAWIDSSNYSVKLRHSPDRGVTWDQATKTISSGGSNVFVWLDARGDKVSAAWYGTDGNPKDPEIDNGPWFLKYSESINAGGTFTAPVKAVAGAVKTDPVCLGGVSCTSGREFGDFLQVAVDAAGKAFIAYVDVTDNSQVKVVKQSA